MEDIKYHFLKLGYRFAFRSEVEDSFTVFVQSRRSVELLSMTFALSVILVAINGLVVWWSFGTAVAIFWITLVPIVLQILVKLSFSIKTGGCMRSMISKPLLIGCGLMAVWHLGCGISVVGGL